MKLSTLQLHNLIIFYYHYFYNLQLGFKNEEMEKMHNAMSRKKSRLAIQKSVLMPYKKLQT